MDSTNKSNTITSKGCSTNKCKDNDGEPKLTCKICQRRVHPECSNLPSYELQRYISGPNDDHFINSYFCRNCIKVPEWLENQIPNKDKEYHSINNKLMDERKRTKMLSLDIENLNKIMCEKDEEISELKRRLQENMLCENNKNKGTQTLTEIDKQNYKSDEQREMNDERVIPHEKSLIKRNDTNNTMIIANLVEKSMKEMKSSLEDFINQKIGNQLTYSSATTRNKEEVRNTAIMKKAKPTIEIEGQKEKVRNIIIHGEAENEDIKDEDFVSKLMTAVQSESKPTAITRLGRKDTNKKRPIKVTFRNTTEKETVIANLRRLKGIEEFNRISITNDYSILERKAIKEFVDKVKEKNDGETDSRIIWKIRGNLENGLKIKRLIKVTKSDDQI